MLTPHSKCIVVACGVDSGSTADSLIVNSSADCRKASQNLPLLTDCDKLGSLFSIHKLHSRCKVLLISGMSLL